MKNVNVPVPKRVVYIPHWIQAMLQRRNISLAACLDYKQMKELLSQEDQAQFLALQPYKLFDATYDAEGYPLDYHYASNGTQVTDEWSIAGSLYEVWAKSLTAEDVASKSILQSVEALCFDKIVTNELKARLFSKESFSEQYQKPFITYDLARNVIGVVVFPGYFTPEKNPSFKVDLLKSILKVFYVYNTYASVCTTPYFRKYLEALAAVTSMPPTAK